MKIGSIGCHYRHEAGFYMDRPEGTGCGVMLLVKTPAKFVINGVEELTPKNVLIIFTPETPYRYGSDDVYIDDWVYFDWQESDREYFGKLGIPLNKIIPIINMEEMSQILRQATYEHYCFDEKSENINAHYMEIFFLKLSRIIQTNTPTDLSGMTNRHYFLQHLRNKIYTNPEEMTNVGEVVKHSGMSYSGFQHLYKKLFGVSVTEDITKSRFLRAEKLLLTTSLNIRSIAQKCGYISEYSFMRKFKEIYGMTPTEYRNASQHYD